jgi:TPR repeat protein
MRSAQQGNIESEIKANRIDHSCGTAPPLTRPRHWQRRALCSDRERQRVQVGDYHYYGWGTHVHHKKAVAHYRTAAESRDAQAYFNLA